MYFVPTYNESVFNLFFVPLLIWSWFCVDREKTSFSRIDSVDSEIVSEGLVSLTDFYKRVGLLFKKRRLSDCQQKISFVQIHVFLKKHFKQKMSLRIKKTQENSKKISSLKRLPFKLLKRWFFLEFFKSYKIE